MKGEGRNVSGSQGAGCDTQGKEDLTEVWAGADLLALTAKLWQKPKGNLEK